MDESDATIIDPLLQLEELAEKIPGAKKGRALGAALENALEAAHGIKPQIERLGELHKFLIFFEANNGVYEKAVLLERIVELKQIGEATQSVEDIDQLIEIRGKLKDVVPLDVRTVEQRLSEAWKAYIQTEFSTAGSLGEVLTKISETSRLGQELAATYEKAKLLDQTLPHSKDKQRQHDTLRNRRNKQLDRLEELGAGPEVVAFLLAVARQEATLDLATSSVYEWLADRDALSKFRIGLAPAGS